MELCSVTSKGQVTIPKALRDRLGIKSATVLAFRVKNGVLTAVKVVPNDPVADVTGCLGADRRTDEWMAELRGAP